MGRIKLTNCPILAAALLEYHGKIESGIVERICLGRFDSLLWQSGAVVVVVVSDDSFYAACSKQSDVGRHVLRGIYDGFHVFSLCCMLVFLDGQIGSARELACGPR